MKNMLVRYCQQKTEYFKNYKRSFTQDISISLDGEVYDENDKKVNTLNRHELYELEQLCRKVQDEHQNMPNDLKPLGYELEKGHIGSLSVFLHPVTTIECAVCPLATKAYSKLIKLLRHMLTKNNTVKLRPIL